MPIEIDTEEYVYTGNGVTTAFSFSSLFQSNADIVVGVNGVLQTTGFTVTGAGNPAGGTVTFTVAPAAAARVVLLRAPPFSQLTEFTTASTISEGAVTRALDKLTMIVQYLLRRSDRSIRLEDLDGSVNFGALPNAVTRAGKVITFDPAGQLILQSLIDATGPLGVLLTQAVADAEADRIAAEAAAVAAGGSATAADASAVAAAASAASITPSAYVSQTGSTGGADLPAGTTAQRPAHLLARLRYNTTIPRWEFSDGASWLPLGGGGGGFRGNNGLVGTAASGDLFRVHGKTLTTSTTIAATENAVCAGPLTVNVGVTLTVAVGGRLVIT